MCIYNHISNQCTQHLNCVKILTFEEMKLIMGTACELVLYKQENSNQFLSWLELSGHLNKLHSYWNR